MFGWCWFNVVIWHDLINVKIVLKHKFKGLWWITSIFMVCTSLQRIGKRCVHSNIANTLWKFSISHIRIEVSWFTKMKTMFEVIPTSIGAPFIRITALYHQSELQRDPEAGHLSCLQLHTVWIGEDHREAWEEEPEPASPCTKLHSNTCCWSFSTSMKPVRLLSTILNFKGPRGSIYDLHTYFPWASASPKTILFSIYGLKLYLVHYLMSKEKIKINLEVTVKIKILCICIQRHPGCVFELKSSATLRYLTNLKSEEWGTSG